jgi:opacity protein-like surface antigen
MEGKMFTAFNKCFLALSSTLLLNTMAHSLLVTEDSRNESVHQCNHARTDSRNCNRLYFGGFGGGIYSDDSKMSQMGTALFPEDVGGPLAVEARGHVKKNGTGFGGVQLGYEWSKCVDQCSSWAIAPGAEMEVYWLSRHIKGNLFNSTDTDRLPEHDFVDTFHMNEGVYLANFILSLNNTWRLSPYVGAGVGATRISLHDADSKQIAPLEAGINHFNSRTHDSSWTFAAQVKAGLRFNICKFHVFGEYRYLFVDTSNYIFGSTVYPTHAHTTPWNVQIEDMQYSAFVFGIQFDLY